MDQASARQSAIVIGIGNQYRCDDAVGIIVARMLTEASPRGVRVREASGEGTELMDAWQDTEFVILVDAVQSGSSPGTIYRLDAHQSTLPSRFFHYSTHAFSVAEAVELARALNRLPTRLVVYGIEGACFAAGEGLSRGVERAAKEVARRVLAELEYATPSRRTPQGKPSSGRPRSTLLSP